MVVLTDTNSIANQFLAELRSESVQKDSMRFRRNLERLGEIFAYEISKTFFYKEHNINTPLGASNVPLMETSLVLATVLRAGLPLHQGLLNYFDTAESAFIAAYRGVPDEKHQFTIEMDYIASPSLDKKVLLLVDPMLATGGSLLRAYQALASFGSPSSIHIVSVIASQKGVDFVTKNIPKHTLWTAAIDDEINSKSYIIPGLGDAGDLSFGRKA